MSPYGGLSFNVIAVGEGLGCRVLGASEFCRHQSALLSKIWAFQRNGNSGNLGGFSADSGLFSADFRRSRADDSGIFWVDSRGIGRIMRNL